MECTDGTHTCQQVCVNTPGAYQCTCFNGFSLNRDGFNCSGEYHCMHVISSWHPLMVIFFVAITHMKMLMNALLEWTTVNITVIIAMDPTHVPADKASDSTVMDCNVMVSYYRTLSSFHYPISIRYQ